jgi:hypothetical protein
MYKTFELNILVSGADDATAEDLRRAVQQIFASRFSPDRRFQFRAAVIEARARDGVKLPAALV